MSFAIPPPFRRVQNRLGRCGSGVALLLVRTLWAETPESLEIVADGCPTNAQLRAQLMPLLGSEADGNIESRRVELHDLGDRYAIQVGPARKQIDDPERDCLERARVAAVFVALNLEPFVRRTEGPQRYDEQRVTRGVALPAHGGMRTSGKPALPLGQRVTRADLGIRAGLRLEHPLEGSDSSWGLTLGGTLRVGRFAYHGSASLLTPIPLALSQPEGASVSLYRVPVTVGVAPLWRVGMVEAGPSFGIGWDNLFVSGRNMPQNARAWRTSPAAVLGIEVQLRPGNAHGSTYANLGVRVTPIKYHLVVEPEGPGGQLPRVWLGLEVGGAWEPPSGRMVITRADPSQPMRLQGPSTQPGDSRIEGGGRQSP